MYIKVYCILAHKNPSQIKDLVNLLHDKKSLFFIHVDKKVNQKEYQNTFQDATCHFIKNRVSCSWGKYSLVQATLNSMKEVQDFMTVNFAASLYHFIMLSGEDLPLKNNEYLHNYLESNSQTSFINYWQLPYDQWWQGGFFRLENLYFFQYKKYPKLNYWVNRIIKRLRLHFLLPLNRFNKQFPDFKIYGSKQWMVLHKDLLNFVLKSSYKNSGFNRIFKYVLAPDELYFATLILNYDTEKNFSIKNLSTHLVHFNGWEVSPTYLDIADLKVNSETDLLFARKFDPNLNSQTIHYIKQLISK